MNAMVMSSMPIPVVVVDIVWYGSVIIIESPVSIFAVSDVGI